MTLPFKTAYGKRTPVRFETTGPSLTHQSMAPECDINTIMQKWEKTGVLEHRNTFEGQYGDFTETPSDYHTSMNAVIAANEMFESLPAKIRRRFANDPGTFLDFVSDPDNKTELEKMGLAKAAPDPVDLIGDDDGQPTPKPPKKASEPSKSAPKPED